MTSDRNRVSSLWLLAAEADEAMLTGVVAALAARHSTPLFHPHLTLLGDIAAGPESLFAVADRIARAAPAFTAAIADIETSETFFRSFYARFPLGQELTALRAAAEAAIGAAAAPFLPHVSLLYGAVPEPAKGISAAEMRQALTGQGIRFDRLVVTNSANDVPIADWRVLHTVRLG